jgi:histone deacetylase 8
LVSALGLFASDYSHSVRLKAVKPAAASRRDLALYHTEDYIDFVLNPQNADLLNSTDGKNQRSKFSLEDDCPVFQGLSQYVQLVAGGSLTAAAALRSMDIAICWDGGR